MSLEVLSSEIKQKMTEDTQCQPLDSTCTYKTHASAHTCKYINSHMYTPKIKKEGRKVGQWFFTDWNKGREVIAKEQEGAFWATKNVRIIIMMVSNCLLSLLSVMCTSLAD